MPEDLLPATSRKVFAPGDEVDRYTLLERLESGSMGEVWKAHHNKLSVPCAIKLLRPELARSSEFGARFATEGEVCGRLRNHPNVVQVYDAGIDEATNTAFLAMELLHGETLGRWSNGHIAMPLGEFRKILPHLSSAIDAAHQLNIVHRDLKPENLFLTKDSEGKPLLKVLDFGIARIIADNGARTATQAGTPAYSAPEQLGQAWREIAAQSGIVIADQISPTTDVWALGLIAYELITGCGADEFWGALSMDELQKAIALEPIPVPKERAGSAAVRLPPGFDEWFQRCLVRDANLRWPTFAEAIAQLIRLIDQHLRCNENEDVRLATAPTEPQLFSATPPPVVPTTTASRRIAVSPPNAAAPQPLDPVPTVPDLAIQPESGRKASSRRIPELVAYALLVAVLLVVALLVAFVPRHGNIIVTVFGVEKRPLANTVQVYLDRQKRCDSSPCILSGLSVNHAYTIRVVAPGYAESIIHGIHVERSKVTPVHVALARTRNAGSLKVTAEGTDLTLWIDGTEVGPLPEEVDPLPPGEHVVRVGGNARYEAYEERLSIAENEHRVLGPLRLKVLVGSLRLEPGVHSEGAKLLLLTGSERVLISKLPHQMELDLTRENRLEATKPGYATLDLPLEFQAGQAEKRLVVSLSPLHPNDPTPHATSGLSTLTIVSQPASTVFLNGRPLGKMSRRNLPVAPGFYVVVFHHPQYKTRKLAITVDTGKTAVAGVTFP